jgi:putative spermidine/putrescine transport system substrate-binding protein
LILTAISCAPTPTPAPPTAAPIATSAPATTSAQAATAPPPTAAPTAATPNFAGKTLNVSFFAFNQDLINKNIVKPFEEKYGAKVLFESGNNADRLAKLVARKDNPNIDVVVHYRVRAQRDDPGCDQALRPG